MPVASLTDRTCLITGAAGGIGRATAEEAHRRGARLVLTDIEAAGLADTAASIRDRGGTVLAAVGADLTSRDEVEARAAEIHSAHGSMDVVMNVAGMSTWGRVEQLRHDDWRRMIDVNLMGPIHVIESFVPPMIAAGRGGHLVNVASAAALFGLPWHAAYSASKFGVRGISEVLRFDLRRHGIGVSLVCPGAVATPLVDSVEIVGIDRNAPAIKQLTERFVRHAVSPERVAQRMLDAVQRNRFMVYTSPDIRAGHWVQRHFEAPYRLAMRALSNRMEAAAREAPLPPVAR